MSGVRIIRHLLANYQPLLAVVPATRIMAGELPINTAMPAISILQISSVPMNMVKAEAKRLHTDRVQVTVNCKGTQGTPAGSGYPQLREILALVLAACPQTRGTVNSVDCDSVTPDMEGPDLSDDAVALYSASRDFFVKWKSTT